MVTLAGTGRVADDLFLMAHDEVSGRPYLSPRAAGLGLAGGLLAELVLGGHAGVGDGGIVLAGRAVPADGLARAVLDAVAGQARRYGLREWLAFLARASERDVGLRLARAGYLREARGWWLRGRCGWAPADPDCAFAAVVRARAALDVSRPCPAGQVVLAGLAGACGLGSRFLQYGPPDARSCLDAAVRGLSPDLRDLVAWTQAAADSAVLSYRRSGA